MGTQQLQHLSDLPPCLSTLRHSGTSALSPPQTQFTGPFHSRRGVSAALEEMLAWIPRGPVLNLHETLLSQEGHHYAPGVQSETRKPSWKPPPSGGPPLIASPVDSPPCPPLPIPPASRLAQAPGLAGQQWLPHTQGSGLRPPPEASLHRLCTCSQRDRTESKPDHTSVQLFNPLPTFYCFCLKLLSLAT